MQCLLFVLTGLFVSSAAHNQVSIDGVSNADCVAAIAFQTVKPKFGDNDGVAGGSELNAVFPTHRWRFDLEHCSLTGEEIDTVSPLVGDAVATAADEAFHQTDKPKYAHDSEGFPGAFFLLNSLVKSLTVSAFRHPFQVQQDFLLGLWSSLTHK